MAISHSIPIGAPRDLVFSVYRNVASWPQWDAEVAEVALPDGLQAGSRGWLRPRRGPSTKILVSDVVPEESFTVESQLPLCRMTFGHELRSVSDKTEATHWVRFDGPLAFLFRRLIGASIASSLPHTMNGLKSTCEQREVR